MKIDIKKFIKYIIIMLIYFVSELVFIPLFDINNLTSKDECVLTLLSSILCSMILILIYRKDLIKDMKSFKKNYRTILKTSITYWLIGYLLLTVSTALVTNIIHYIGNNQSTLEGLINTNKLYMIISVTIFSPFVEEMIFRKSIRDFCKSDLLFMIISGLIFGYMHVMSETVLINYLLIIPYAIFGYIFAKAYVETDNIFTSIIMHMIHNTFAIVLLLLV